MKWTWKEWTVFGVCAAAVIAEICLVYFLPTAAIAAAAGFIAGGAVGYLLKKKEIVNG